LIPYVLCAFSLLIFLDLSYFPSVGRCTVRQSRFSSESHQSLSFSSWIRGLPSFVLRPVRTNFPPTSSVLPKNSSRGKNLSFFPSIALCIRCLPFSPACLIFAHCFVRRSYPVITPACEQNSTHFPALHFFGPHAESRAPLVPRRIWRLRSRAPFKLFILSLLVSAASGASIKDSLLSLVLVALTLTRPDFGRLSLALSLLVALTLADSHSPFLCCHSKHFDFGCRSLISLVL
jgi:hypothetical protein